MFKEKELKKALTKHKIEDILSRITIKPVSNYNQRNSRCVLCRVLYSNTPAPDIPVRFQLTEGEGFITSLAYSDTDGVAQCDVNVSKEYPINKIRAWVDIEGVSADLVFHFSSVKPKPVITASPLEVKHDCFVFELKESNDVDVLFNQYEVLINAEYKNASFVNYYIARVDNSKHSFRSFNLLSPIRIKGGTSQVVRIPFNSWIKENLKNLDKWYMGSELDYRIVLRGEGTFVTTQ